MSVLKFENFDEHDMEKFLEEMMNQMDFDELDELELEHLMNEMAVNDYAAFHNMFNEEIAVHMLVMDSIEEVLEKYSLSKNPLTNQLQDCLNAYTKDGLFTIGEDNGLYLKKSMKKAEMVETLGNHIKKTMSERMVLLGNSQRKRLENALLNDFNMEHLVDQDIKFLVEGLPIAIKLGLVVARLTKDGELTIHATAECYEAFENIRKHQKNVKGQLKQYREFNNVLKAAVHLYGVIDFQRFYRLYEIHYPTFDVTNEFHEMLETILPILIIQNGYHFINRNLIGSFEFENESEVVQFYHGTKLKMQNNYYEPTKRDIRYYAKHSFDREIKEYWNLQKKVKAISDVPKMALDVIESGLRLGALPSEVFTELQELELINLESIDEIEPFLNSYMQMNNETRMWVNAGYKPGELKRI